MTPPLPPSYDRIPHPPRDYPFDGLSDLAPGIASVQRNTVRMAWVVVLTFVLFVVGLIAGLLYVAAQVTS